ncbi:MAG: amidohydrolase family protein [Alphaproteobacteria bacterium]|nr:amidohydrolase family protein [Alphaproteobacteria bacterium]
MSDAPKHIHAAEQVKEVEASLAHSGKRPVEWLLENAPIDKTWCFIHSTHLTEAETDALAASGAVAGLCPTTEGNLGDGIFNGARFFEKRGHFGIGTDSHIMVNPAEELRLLEYSQRLAHKGRALLLDDGKSCGRTLWDKAVTGGNRAMGTHEAGLMAGTRADFLTLDLSHPLFAGKNGDAILDTAIFGSVTLPVQDVYVGGKAAVKDGHHPLQAQAAQAFSRTLLRLTA